jgi:hypothetical protein
LLSWSIKDLWGTKVMYCYVVKWPVFRLQRGSLKSPIAPSNFSPLWVTIYYHKQFLKPLLYLTLCGTFLTELCRMSTYAIQLPFFLAGGLLIFKTIPRRLFLCLNLKGVRIDHPTSIGMFCLDRVVRTNEAFCSN